MIILLLICLPLLLNSFAECLTNRQYSALNSQSEQEGHIMDKPKMAAGKSSSRYAVDLPDVWRAVCGNVVHEICGDNSAYFTPVPILSENGRDCLPLQVFTDDHPLNSGAVVKLDPTQKRLLFTSHDRKSGLVAIINQFRRRYLVQERPRTSTEETNLLEEISQMSGPNNFEIMHKSKCFLRQPQDTKPDGGYQATFKLGIYNVQVRKVDPRKLLDCMIESTSPVARLAMKRRFYMIYETHLAEKVTCHVKLSQLKTKNDATKETSLKQCPVAFRYVEIRVDRQGVVKDIIFNVTRHKLIKLNVM